MDENEPDPQKLNYATPRKRGAKPPRDITELTAFRFTLGAGLSTLVAAYLILSGPADQFPMTMACGGLGCLIIQAGLILTATNFYRWTQEQGVRERSALRTFFAGVVGGAMLYTFPFWLRRLTTNEASYVVVTVIPLFIYPVLMPPFLLNCVCVDEADEA